MKHVAEKHPHAWTNKQIEMENKQWVPLLELEKIIEELQNLKPFVLSKEDHLNIQKWQTATSMMIQTKMRTPYSQSEHDTSNKLMQIVDRAFIPKDEVLGVQK